MGDALIVRTDLQAARTDVTAFSYVCHCTLVGNRLTTRLSGNVDVELCNAAW